MKAELASTETELDPLWAKVDKPAGAHDDAKAMLTDVREEWARTKAKLSEVEASTESTWDVVKA